jgi:hypothetical protein
LTLRGSAVETVIVMGVNPSCDSAPFGVTTTGGALSYTHMIP